MRIRIETQCGKERHWVEILLHSWRHWEVVATQCTERLGPALGKLAECYQSARKRTEDVRHEVLYEVARSAGRESTEVLVDALEDEEHISDALLLLGVHGDERALPALTVLHASYAYEKEAYNALQSRLLKPLPLEEAISQLVREGRWGIIKNALPTRGVFATLHLMGEEALAPLHHIVWTVDDFSTVQEAVETIGKIGGVKAEAILREILANHRIKEAREEAEYWLRR